MMTAPLTGRKVFFMFAGAFGVIISVNLFMASMAVGTFPGLVVSNGYVASQTFDEERRAQLALGWSTDISYADGLLTLVITGKDGARADVGKLESLLGRPTHLRDDVVPEFQQRDGKFVAPVDLSKGNWDLRLNARSLDGVLFHQRLNFYVDG